MTSCLFSVGYVYTHYISQCDRVLILTPFSIRQDSDDAPTEVLFMVELRANPASKHPALRALALNSTKVPQNQKRFAFLMYSPRVMEWMSAHHVRTALKAGPVWGEGVINKVLVDYDPRVEFVKTPYRQAPMPFPAPGMLPSQMFTYTPVAFKGFNVDGTKVPKHEKEKKKDAGKKK